MSKSKYEFIEPDVDLDTETVLLPSGERLTNDRADEIVSELVERRGRPSLSGRKATSPAVSFRLDQDTLVQVQKLAEQERLTVSQLARRALDEFLTKAVS